VAVDPRQPGADRRRLGRHEPLRPASGRPGFGTLGDYVFLSPTKLGGGAHCADLQTGKTLAWIEYWNYGDSCRSRIISRHIHRPSRARASSFVNSAQGGENVLIYGLPTEIKQRGLLEPIWGQGNHIYACTMTASR